MFKIRPQNRLSSVAFDVIFLRHLGGMPGYYCKPDRNIFLAGQDIQCFMEPECSLLCSQNYSMGVSLEPQEPNSNSHPISLEHI